MKEGEGIMEKWGPYRH